MDHAAGGTAASPAEVAHGAPADRDHGRGDAHTAGSGAHGQGAASAGGEEVLVDVYLMAFRFGYTPATLRLERGQRYRFRMMAVDADHGASLSFGVASRMIRLRANALIEQELVFTESGVFPIYCTVFCGIAHDVMRAKIIVE